MDHGRAGRVRSGTPPRPSQPPRQRAQFWLRRSGRAGATARRAHRDDSRGGWALDWPARAPPPPRRPSPRGAGCRLRPPGEPRRARPPAPDRHPGARRRVSGHGGAPGRARPCAPGACRGPRALGIVGGLDGLGLAVMRELRAAGAEVVAIGSAAEAAEHGLDVERLGVRLTVGSARSPGTLAAAGLPSARALVLTADDDTGNVESALATPLIAPDLPVVIRLFNEAMSTYLTETLRGVTALSTSRLAAPIFVELTDQALAAVPPARAPVQRARRRQRHLYLPSALFVGLLAFVVPSTIYFASVLELRWIDALYFVWTTITTVGYDVITFRNAPHLAQV